MYCTWHESKYLSKQQYVSVKPKIMLRFCLQNDVESHFVFLDLHAHILSYPDLTRPYTKDPQNTKKNGGQVS